MSENNEKKEYEKKLEKQIELIEGIKKFDINNLISPIKLDSLNDKVKKAKQLLYKLQKNEYEIAIVGLEKAGKSTFANALIGNDILPTKDERCTYTSTSIRAGEDKAVIEFLSREEFDTAFKERLKKIKIPNYENMSFETLALNTYETFYNELDEETKENYGANLNQDIRNILNARSNISKYLSKPKQEIYFTEIEQEKLLSNEKFEIVRKFIQEKEYALAVKEITIYSNRLVAMENAVIYDVPGFDSPTKIHRDQTIDKMKSADAIILIANGRSPSFTGPLVDIFRKETDYDGIKLGDKLFVFINLIDAATDPDKNINTIKNELFNNYSIMKKDFDKRIVPGSALAYLQKENKVQVNGVSVLNVLKEKGIQSDGINEIKKLLESYNEDERFEIIKTRINKLKADIEEIFKDLNKEYYVESDGLASSEIIKLSLDFESSTRSNITTKLNKYKANIKEKYEVGERNISELPLSNKLKEKIEELITIEKFGVTGEEKGIEILNSNSGTTQVTNSTRVEIKLRENKSITIFNAFCDEIIQFAVDEHKKCDEEILNIFLEEFGLSNYKNTVYSTKAISNIKEYVEKSKKEVSSLGFYQSLIERFSRDLFDVVLLRPYGSSERWENFIKERTNFYSLSMFNENKDESQPASRQPMIYDLLFHDELSFENKTKVKDIVNIFENIFKIAMNPFIYSSIKLIVKTNSGKAEQIIKNAFSSFDNDMNDNQKENVIKSLFNYCFDEAGVEEINDYDLTEETYRKYFSEKQNKSYEDVVNDIAYDIELLQKLLLSTVIYAVNIEKPFISKEVNEIENIIASFETNEFRDFISHNIMLIKSSEFNNLEKNEQIRKANAEFVKFINEKLKEI